MVVYIVNDFEKPPLLLPFIISCGLLLNVQVIASKKKTVASVGLW